MVQQINQWEKEAIRKIQQTANEAKQLVMEHTAQHFRMIEMKLGELTKELKQTREENDVNEIHLDRLNKELKALENELNQPSTISIREDSSSASLVKKISVVTSSGKEKKRGFRS